MFHLLSVQTEEKALKYALHVQLVNYRYSQKLSPFESVFLTQMLGCLIPVSYTHLTLPTKTLV